MNISIIIPVYNSSKILKTLLENIDKYVANKCEFLELILVNDSSSDQSWEEIKTLKKKYIYIKGINLKENYGQHSAIFCGLKNCKGEIVVCMDDDMQHDPKHVLNMASELNNYEVCYVKYKKREHNYIKILISKLNNHISSFLMRKSHKIYTSSFKCFNKKIAKKIISNDETFVFLDYWIFQYTNSITCLEVTHNKRMSGNTNYGLRQLITLWSKMIFLIEVNKYSVRFILLFLIKNFFKIFLSNYINFKKDNKIDIIEII